MKKGPEKFSFYLSRLQLLLDKAALQKNPALWLYKNDARTPLFMLEGLAKLYSEIHNKKKFAKLKSQFKLLEDTLGAIDYYDGMCKDLSNIKKFPAGIITYLQAQTREKIQSLNEILIEKQWLAKTNNRIQKIEQKLKTANWLKEEKEVIAINDFYGEAIYGITAFVQTDGFVFKNIEADVHELRRKLRWLSIYPQALRGTIQITARKQMPAFLKKYLTKEITGSTFNKMPDPGDATCFLILEQNHFYALSWMIAELGIIKDEGLHVIAVKEAVQQTNNLEDPAAFKKAYALLGKKQTPINELLITAATLSKRFFGEQNLEHLVLGIKKLDTNK